MDARHYLDALNAYTAPALHEVSSESTEDSMTIQGLRALASAKDQAYAIMAKAGVLDFSRARRLMSHAHDDESAIEALSSFCTVVHGNWVLNSDMFVGQVQFASVRDNTAGMRSRIVFARNFLLSSLIQHGHVPQATVAEASQLRGEVLRQVMQSASQASWWRRRGSLSSAVL